MKSLMMAILAVAMIASQSFGQGCNSGNQVDFGNADLGRQLSSTQQAPQLNIEQLRSLLAQAATPGHNAVYDDGRTYMNYAAKEKLVNGQFQNVAMRQAAASASSSTASGLNQPGYLTFQENVVARQVMPVPEVSNGEVAALRAEISALMAEVRSLQSARSSVPVFQTAAFQSGGAAASSSASTAAPSIGQLALTAPAPVAARSSQSACSSGGCGRSRGSLLPRRQVSRSRSFSSSTSR